MSSKAKIWNLQQVRKVFLRLVKMFYANINFNERVITFEVCKIKISLIIEDFDKLCDLPFFGTLFSRDGLSTTSNFKMLFATQSLLTDLKACHRFICFMEYITIYYRIIHYMVSHVLFLRKSNHVKLLRTNVINTWLLSNNIKANWYTRVIQHMLDCWWRCSAWLSYGVW